MATYTFHHYGRSEAPSGMTFSDHLDDDDALDEARRLLDRHALRCVEICHDTREVGTVRRAPPASNVDAGTSPRL